MALTYRLRELQRLLLVQPQLFTIVRFFVPEKGCLVLRLSVCVCTGSGRPTGNPTGTSRGDSKSGKETESRSGLLTFLGPYYNVET